MNVLRKIIWKCITRNRLSAVGMPRQPNVLDQWLQRLFESQHSRWIFQFLAPLEESRQYAKAVVPGKDFTAHRIQGRPDLIRYVTSLFNEDTRGSSWFELGCCDCANLLTLKKFGFIDLSGVEINESFLKAGKEFDPVGFSGISTRCDSLENYVSNAREKYDVLFSCAVMQHINPNMNNIFEGLASIAKNYIICVESENQCNAVHYPRNYRRIFEKYGFRQIRSALIQRDVCPNIEEGYWGYTVRLLERTH